MVMRSVLAAVCLAVLASQPAPAQQAQQGRRTLTIDDLYSFEGWTRFNGNPIANMSWVPEGGPWLDDTHYLWPDRDADAGAWLRVDATSGASAPLFDVAALESALRKAPDFPSQDAARVARRRPIIDERRRGLLLTSENTLYYYDISRARLARLTTSPEPKSEATFSPDGQFVVFVKENNLYVTDVTAPGERALTGDGAPKVFNGILDWVYSEELYGRGTYRAYWWSPDSTKIAFLQLDDRSVPDYTLVDDIPYHPTLDTWPYPKAGDPNPRARVFVIDINDALRLASRGERAQRRLIDTDKYNTTADFLVSHVGWTPDSHSVVYQLQDRQQTWLDVNTADAASGATRTLFRETSKTWVQRWDDESAGPVWLKDGSFLWLSERTGWRHLYHYSAAGALITQVTSGEWEVRATHGTDAAGEWAYFSGTERSPLGIDLYAVRLDGSGLHRLTAAAGTHVAFFNRSGSLFLDSSSTITTPPQVTLESTQGGLLRRVDANPTTAARDYGLSTPEFVQVNTRDGFVMEAMMIKPPDFDPTRRYPVYQFTYGGPHAQQVLNAWTPIWTDYAYHQLLAARGVIVWICDNRTSSGKGVVSAWPLYKNLGALELQDIEDGLAWLTQQPYIDGSRIGIAGVSYGGFMTLYALTHSKRFAMGIAEGAVSDWRNYDSIYTERYLGLPKDNPAGYRRSSPRFSAADLHGELLLIHSALDDNVHPQNATQMAYELQKAGKPFQMMLYPRSAHGVNAAEVGPHLHRLTLDFTLKALGIR